MALDINWLRQQNFSATAAAKLYCGDMRLAQVDPKLHKGNADFYSYCYEYYGADAWVLAVNQQQPAVAVSDAGPKPTQENDKNAYIPLDELHLMMTQIEQMVEAAGYHPTLAMLFTGRAATLIDKQLRNKSADVRKQYHDGLVTYQELLRALIEVGNGAHIRF